MFFVLRSATGLPPAGAGGDASNAGPRRASVRTVMKISAVQRAGAVDDPAESARHHERCCHRSRGRIIIAGLR